MAASARPTACATESESPPHAATLNTPPNAGSARDTAGGPARARHAAGAPQLRRISQHVIPRTIRLQALRRPMRSSLSRPESSGQTPAPATRVLPVEGRTLTLCAVASIPLPLGLALAGAAAAGGIWAYRRARQRQRALERDRQRTADELNRRLSELFWLQELSYVLSESIKLERIVEQVVRYAMRFIDARGALVALAGENPDDPLTIAAAEGS